MGTFWGRITACGFTFVRKMTALGCKTTPPLNTCSKFELAIYLPFTVFLFFMQRLWAKRPFWGLLSWQVHVESFTHWSGIEKSQNTFLKSALGCLVASEENWLNAASLLLFATHFGIKGFLCCKYNEAEEGNVHSYLYWRGNGENTFMGYK